MNRFTNALLRVLAMVLILTLCAAASGCGASEKRAIKAKMEAVMNYTESERQQISEYLKYSKGVSFSAYKYKNSDKPLRTVKTPDFSTLPDIPELEDTGYVRASAYVSFAQDGNQHIQLKGVKDADITVTFNELHTEPYDDSISFTAGVFYKINVSYRYSAETSPVFTADSEYELSTTAPLFGGVPSEPVKPILDLHLRDAYILNGPDEYYYMTGTNDPVDWNNTREIHVYRSADLSSWEDLGAVWNFERDATWQKDILIDSSPIWAPELHYIGGTYWICYSLGWGSMSGSLLRSTTGRPEGPYADVSGSGKPMFDYIDSTLFRDDNGRVYAIWSDGQLQELSNDLTSLKGERVALKSRSGIQAGFEGCFMIKIGGIYYLCSSTYSIHYRSDGSSYQTYDSFYVMSDNISGPYSERRLLLENGGHNNLFFSKDGRLFTTAFYGNDFSEKPAIAEIEVTDEGLLKVR
ncbi:MAG: family 43 glycosylhydrolase [Clostridia bacterium]|nr:family 43 glycosylhydrolase [Clostridia bacterium]